MLDFLNYLLNRHPEKMKANVEIYTWATCPFCIRAKLLLWWKGIKFTEYKIDGNEEARIDILPPINRGIPNPHELGF